MRRFRDPLARRRCLSLLAGQSAAGLALPPARAGVAAIEFGLLAPVVVVMLAGLYDITQAFIAWERVTLAAQAIDQIATTIAATPPNNNFLTLAQATTASTAVYAYLPNLLWQSPPAYSVTISSIAMVPLASGGASCTGPTTCAAQVAWSGTFVGTTGTTQQRQCGLGVIIQSTDTAAPSPTSLPANVYSPSSLLVVDVTYQFTPTFFRFLTGGFTIAESAYYPPRIGLQTDYITYTYVAPDATTVCTPAPA